MRRNINVFILSTVILSTAIFSLTGCLSGEADDIKALPVTSDFDKQALSEGLTENNNETSMQLTGTIEYQSFEGGFYGFISKDGQKYTLSKLAPEHRQHGLVVKIHAEPMPDMATTTQFGQLIRVVNIEVLDDSKVAPISKGETM